MAHTEHRKQKTPASNAKQIVKDFGSANGITLALNLFLKLQRIAFSRHLRESARGVTLINVQT